VIWVTFGIESMAGGVPEYIAEEEAKLVRSVAAQLATMRADLTETAIARWQAYQLQQCPPALAAPSGAGGGKETVDTGPASELGEGEAGKDRATSDGDEGAATALPTGDVIYADDVVHEGSEGAAAGGGEQFVRGRHFITYYICKQSSSAVTTDITRTLSAAGWLRATVADVPGNHTWLAPQGATEATSIEMRDNLAAHVMARSKPGTFFILGTIVKGP